MEITDVKNPRSKNAQRSVDLDISTDGVTFIPFTAMPGDTAGNDLFEKACGGEFGSILIAPGDYWEWTGSGWAEYSAEVVRGMAEATKARLMQTANAALIPLQDAADLGMATGAETLALTAWKKYRVLLSRVDVSAGAAIIWPEVPADVA